VKLLERDGPLAALRRALADARRREGRVALVAGGAGLGKTSLVRAFLEGVDDRADGRDELRAQLQEHGARAGQVLGDERVEQSAGHPALHDDPAERRRRGQRVVVVDRVAVAGDLGEPGDVPGADRAGALRALPDLGAPVDQTVVVMRSSFPVVTRRCTPGGPRSSRR
jgi:hypothetical protein